MKSDGKHSSCITTICFLGIHYRQLCCQLSSCLLVRHMGKLLMDWLDLLKTGHFCSSLKCLFSFLSFLQDVQQVFMQWFYWPLTTGCLHIIMNGYFEKRIIAVSTLNQSIDGTGKRLEKGKWNDQGGRTLTHEYRLRISAHKCAKKEAEIQNVDLCYHEI